jgi:hypothetical protein
VGFSTVAAAGVAIAGVENVPIEVNAILAIVTLFFPARSSRQQKALAEHPTEHAFPTSNHVRKPVGVSSGEVRVDADVPTPIAARRIPRGELFAVATDGHAWRAWLLFLMNTRPMRLVCASSIVSIMPCTCRSSFPHLGVSVCGLGPRGCSEDPSLHQKPCAGCATTMDPTTGNFANSSDGRTVPGEAKANGDDWAVPWN